MPRLSNESTTLAGTPPHGTSIDLKREREPEGSVELGFATTSDSVTTMPPDGGAKAWATVAGA
jgi:hypothetical protein